MTLLARVLLFFPMMHVLSIVTTFVAMIVSLVRGNLLVAAIWGVALLIALYLIAPALFRIHNIFYPLREGPGPISSQNGKPVYSPWWGGHQFQAIYIAFPALETFLRLVPGAYSPWLRLWGAKVGKSVYWTSHFAIGDRSMVSIGDGVILGHSVALSSHVVRASKSGAGGVKLYLKRIEIGSGSFIGAESRLGPGTKIEPGVTLPYRTCLVFGQTVKVDDPRFASRGQNATSS